MTKHIRGLVRGSGVFYTITCWLALMYFVPNGAMAQTTLGVASDDPRPRIRVSSSRELLDNVGSDRILILAEGEYFLNDVITYNIFTRWDPVHDGFSLTIKHIKNLTLVGEGKQGARLLVQPRYAYVLNFEQCHKISLINLTFGHTPEQGTCSNGVLGFHECTDILVQECDILGSGTEGLVLSEVTRFLFERSQIRECTDGILSIYDSSQVTFSESIFRDNSGWYWGMRLKNVDTVAFSNCTIADNRLTTPLIGVENSPNVTVAHCNIHNNTFQTFSNDPILAYRLASASTRLPTTLTPTPSLVASEFPIERIDAYEVVYTNREPFLFIRSVSQISTYTREWEEPPQSGKVAAYVNGFYQIRDGILSPIWEMYGGEGYEDHLIEADFWCAGDCVSIEAIRTYYLDRLFCVQNTWTYYRDVNTTSFCVNTSHPSQQILSTQKGLSLVSLEENGVVRVEYTCFAEGTFGEYRIGGASPDACHEGYGHQCFVYDPASSLYRETSCAETQEE